MTLEEIKQFLEDNKDQEEVKTYVKGLSQVTPDGVKQFLESDEGKKLIQPELDRYSTKGIESWKNNNLKKLVDEEVKKRNPSETPEQKEVRELREQFANMEKEKNRESNKNKALNVLSEKKLPSHLVDFFVGDDEETTLANLSQFEEVFTNQLQSSVEARLKADGTNLADPNKKPTSFTKEQIQKMSQADINKNWDAIKGSLNN